MANNNYVVCHPFSTRAKHNTLTGNQRQAYNTVIPMAVRMFKSSMVQEKINCIAGNQEVESLFNLLLSTYSAKPTVKLVRITKDSLKNTVFEAKGTERLSLNLCCTDTNNPDEKLRPFYNERVTKLSESYSMGQYIFERPTVMFKSNGEGVTHYLHYYIEKGQIVLAYVLSTYATSLVRWLEMSDIHDSVANLSRTPSTHFTDSDFIKRYITFVSYDL